ncbi:MAG: hypothetical protein AB1500_12060 [Bacillota bacterium]
MAANRREGFRAGMRAGYNQGYKEGLDAGYEMGLAEGKVFGYNEGFIEALCLEKEVINTLLRLKELLSQESSLLADIPFEISKALDKLEKIV